MTPDARVAVCSQDSERSSTRTLTNHRSLIMRRTFKPTKRRRCLGGGAGSITEHLRRLIMTEKRGVANGWWARWREHRRAKRQQALERVKPGVEHRLGCDTCPAHSPSPAGTPSVNAPRHERPAHAAP